MSEYRMINWDGARSLVKELKSPPSPDCEWVTPGTEILNMNVSLGTFLGVLVIESETVLLKQVL